MEKLQTQASKLWQLLFAPETADTYQKMLALTGTILKETALLLWLLFCSIFVLGAWLGKTGLAWGRDTRSWLDAQSQAEGESGEKAAATGQAIMEVGQTGAYFLLDKAYEQLGLEKPVRPEKPVVTVSAPKTSPKPVATSAPAAPKSSANPKPPAVKSPETPVKETKIAPEPTEDKEETGATAP
ncbi:MAG: hypothetical protein AAFQ61_11010 [Cyanobacteria bacterium J06626_23]